MKVFLVELEPRNRYNQWETTFVRANERCWVGCCSNPRSQKMLPDTTSGAFLNFSGTNYWKSEQLKTISKMIADGEVSDGDYFLYTDAWNPTVIQLKYMAELLGINIKIGGMWHARSYDPDFLGRLIGDAPG